MRNLRRLLAALFLGLVGVLAAADPGIADATATGGFDARQVQDIRTIIKNYLMENPEVLRDAITELDAKEKKAEAVAQKKALADVASQLYDAPGGIVVGNPNGKITLVEFFDYNCGYCKRALPDLERLVKENKDLKIVLRDFPILSPGSVEAALVAVAAHNQFSPDKFWDFHQKLLGQHNPVGREQALSVAKGLGADMSKLEAESKDVSSRKAVERSDGLARSLSLNGTPTFVVGDAVLVGAVGYDKINEAIGNVRKCGKAMCS